MEKLSSASRNALHLNSAREAVWSLEEYESWILKSTPLDKLRIKRFGSSRAAGEEW
jgi:hypothetical protein